MSCLNTSAGRVVIALALATTAPLVVGCGDEEEPPVTTEGGRCVDADGDGFGLGCRGGLDCDDADPDHFRAGTAFADLDGDGFTTSGLVQVCAGADLPAGYASAQSGNDCDDADAAVFEIALAYVDGDGDTFGAGSPLMVCSGEALPTGFAEVGGDCDDSDPDVHQQLLGYTDGDADGVGAGSPALLCSGETLASGFAAVGGDCDDADDTIVTGCLQCVDVDGDGYGVGCENGPDCDDGDDTVHQVALLYADADGDGVSGTPVTLCIGDEAPEGFLEEPTGLDCDDSDADVYDEIIGYPDADGDGTGQQEAVLVCAGEELPAGYSDTPGDCNDDDADNTTSCDSCADADGDGVFVECDSFEVRPGPDCDDTDGGAYQQVTVYPDRDGDSFTFGIPELRCIGDEAPEGYALEESETDDCDDLDGRVYRLFEGYLDHDGDGVTAKGPAVEVCVGADDPAYLAATASEAGDCDDFDPEVYQTLSGYRDWDEDGYTPEVLGPSNLCVGDALPDDYLAEASADVDCDDLDASVNVDGTEIPGDGIDQDCSGGDLPPTDLDGVFVAKGVIVEGEPDGSMAAPFATIADGVAAAEAGAGSRVYVAAGNYSEEIRTTVSIFGGFPSSFSTWNPTLYHTRLHLDLAGDAETIVTVPATATVTLGNVEIGPAVEEVQVDAVLVQNAGRLLLHDNRFGGAADGQMMGVYNAEGGQLVARRNQFESLAASGPLTALSSAGSATLVENDFLSLMSSTSIVAVDSAGDLFMTWNKLQGFYLESESEAVDVGAGEVVGVRADGTSLLWDNDILLDDCSADEVVGIWATGPLESGNRHRSDDVYIECDARVTGLRLEDEATLRDINVTASGVDPTGVEVAAGEVTLIGASIGGGGGVTQLGINVLEGARLRLADSFVVGCQSNDGGICVGLKVAEGAAATVEGGLVAGADSSSPVQPFGVWNFGELDVLDAAVVGARRYGSTEYAVGLQNESGQSSVTLSALCGAVLFQDEEEAIAPAERATIVLAPPEYAIFSVAASNLDGQLDLFESDVGVACNSHGGQLFGVSSEGPEATLRLRRNTILTELAEEHSVGVDLAGGTAWLTDNEVSGVESVSGEGAGLHIGNADAYLLINSFEGPHALLGSYGGYLDHPQASMVAELSEFRAGTGSWPVGLMAEGEMFARDCVFSGTAPEIHFDEIQAVGPLTVGLWLGGGYFAVDRSFAYGAQLDDGLIAAGAYAASGANLLLTNSAVVGGATPPDDEGAFGDAAGLWSTSEAIVRAFNNTLVGGWMSSIDDLGVVAVVWEGNAFGFPNLVLVNNVIEAGRIDDTDQDALYGLWIAGEQPGVALINNLVYGHSAYAPLYSEPLDLAARTAGQIDQCTWLGCSSASGTLVTDPLYADFETGDLSLTEGSPAIDAGLDPADFGLHLYTDIEGEVRPQGAGYDLGAFEWVAPE